MRELHISKSESGGRLDKYLKHYFNAASSSFLYKMLRKKNIILNDKKAKGSELLKENDVIKVYFSDETFDKMRGGDDSLHKRLSTIRFDDISIIYEDDDIIAADKPFGLLSMPDGRGSLNINDMLISYMISSGKLSEDDFSSFHPSVANRLDRNTGGIILFGKTPAGSRYLSDMIRENKIEKYYVCVVEGEINGSSLLCGFWSREGKRAIITDYKREGAYPVKTEISPINACRKYTYLKVRLYTGKTHQIRAHLASIGHPVIGDPLYNANKASIKHQLLFCNRIVLGDREIKAPIPAIFDEFR